FAHRRQASASLRSRRCGAQRNHTHHRGRDPGRSSLMATTFRAFSWALSVCLGAALATWAQPAIAKQCRIDGVTTYTGNVHDVLATERALFVASDGGVEKFDRKTRHLIRKYTHLDGLSRLAVKDL